MPAISFIIPAYNAEETLERALNSICSQKEFTDYEILVIDDGSQDNTVAVAKKFAQKEAKLKVLTAGNGVGVGQARNVGLKHATGQWIAFLDADDFYIADTLKQALNIAHKNDADLQIFSFEHGQKPIDLSFKTTLTSLSARCKMLEKPTNYLTVWGKFFKREIIATRKLYFDEELTMAEDSEFLIRYSACCSKTCSSNLIMYHYSIDTPSVTRIFAKEKISAYLKTLVAMNNFMVSQPKELQVSFFKFTLIQLNIIAVRFIYVATNPASMKQKKQTLLEVCQDPIIKQALNVLPLKACLTPHLLPGLFLKLKLPQFAILLFKIRSRQNQIRENTN
ncbi:MAG: glycosyltransferase family 2 protein [Lactobacillus sp.]|nr:glycosyltransferase family 2 protein [Lactobacillus sp.]